MKCPTCGSKDFYIKDADDEYEIHEFSTTGGNITFSEAFDETPEITDKIKTFCHTCAWHGKISTLK